jgi:hypothetical protein
MTRPSPYATFLRRAVPLDPPHAARLDASDRRVAWIAGLIAVAVGVAVMVMLKWFSVSGVRSSSAVPSSRGCAPPCPKERDERVPVFPVPSRSPTTRAMARSAGVAEQVTLAIERMR